MRTVGDTTTFEHVRRGMPNEELQQPHTVFLVQFDGEWETWFLDIRSTVQQGMDELREYYRKDWAGTGRVIPVKILKHDEYQSINCI